MCIRDRDKEAVRSRYQDAPNQGINFKVNKVFIQTPGPEAGKIIEQCDLNMIKDEHLPAMQGMFPSWITSCSKDGEPNTTVISQIWYVDENHVALSFQFFNKTRKNIQENPYAVTTVVNPNDMSMYTLDLKFDHSETEGDLFDEMDMKLEAIASMQGMSGIYKLLAADVYKVLKIS